MKIVNIMVPLGILAVATVAANAQSIPALPDLNSENPGDLILGFSNAGASKDLLVDVGPANDYYTPATALTLSGNASNGTLTAGNTYTVVAYNPADLSTVYGANAFSASTFWTVVGGNGADGGPLGSTPLSSLWVSAPSTTTVLRESALNQGNLSNTLDTITNGISGSGNVGGQSFASNDAATPGTKSFTLALTGGNNFGYFGGGQVVGNTSGTSSLILYELQPTSSGTAPGVELGTFNFSSSGLTFTAFSAIPEPSAYAAVLGALTVGFVMIRRRSKSAALNAVS